MISERLFPTIVHKAEKKEEYVNDPITKRFPLLQLYDELSQKQDTLQILLVGEGSIGKSTSLRLLQAELMIRGIYCARYECRHLNDRSIPDIRKEMEKWPKDTVVMIDAYDELPGAYTKELDELVNEFANAKFPLIVTSRSKPEANVYEEMAHYEVCPFADQQIEKILEKEQVPPTAPCYGLLHNTMFLAIYLYLDKYKHEYSINMDDLEDEASFLLTYFHALFLSKDTKTKAEDREQEAIPRVERSLAYIGEDVFMNRSKKEVEKRRDLPEALNNIVTQKEDDDLGYIITATQIKYENFFVALYMMEELLLASKKQDIDRARRLFDISLMDDHTDAYVYAGQLLRKKENGKAVLGWLNDEKVYPKSFCEGYTHVLLLYLGMNKGCFNCGEIGKKVFEPRFFGLRKVRTADIGTKNDHPIFDIGADTFIFYSPVKDFQTNEKTTGEPNFPAEIPAFGFYQCRWLVKINIPDDIAHIGTAAFLQCNNLHSVSFSRNITTIENYVFSECHSLQEITLHEGITHIGFFAFQECKDLRHLTIPKKVEAIMEGAFWKCCSLKNISILSSNTKFSRNSFSNPLPRIRVPHGSTPWYRSQLPSSCTIIETDFEQNIDIEQENDLTL